MSLPFPKGKGVKWILFKFSATYLSSVIMSRKQPSDPSPPRTATIILVFNVFSKERISVKGTAYFK